MKERYMTRRAAVKLGLGLVSGGGGLVFGSDALKPKKRSADSEDGGNNSSIAIQEEDTGSLTNDIMRGGMSFIGSSTVLVGAKLLLDAASDNLPTDADGNLREIIDVKMGHGFGMPFIQYGKTQQELEK